MDVLQDRLFRARAAGALFAHSVAERPWGLELPADTQLAVHAMVRGAGALWVDDAGAAVTLQAGDIVMVRGPRVHRLAHAPAAHCADLAAFSAGHGQDGNSAGPPSTTADEFLCGAYRFVGDVGQSLLDMLPDVLHIRPRAGDRIGTALQMLALELTERQAGQHMVLDRLLDVVLVQAIRHHLDDPATTVPPWYVATGHPALRVALQAMHEHPEHPWTVPELAELAAMSRSTFARTFREMLHQTPGHYLTAWRMTLARDALRDSSDKLSVVAKQCGYSTAYAFSAAFTRHHGRSPGKWRAQQVETVSLPSAAE